MSARRGKAGFRGNGTPGNLRRTAIAIRAHSGWGALVAVAGSPGKIEVIERRRIAITKTAVPGTQQPYHFAQRLKLPEAEKHLANCAAVSEGLAKSALRDVVEELRNRLYAIAGCAILLASGRPLGSLSEILVSHALIHTAEGEFFRQSFWKACEALAIPVTGIRERELEKRGQAVFGKSFGRVCDEIANLGRTIGPPWTTDQKTAALAAMLLLADSVPARPGSAG